jgi:hypothetical protein
LRELDRRDLAASGINECVSRICGERDWDTEPGVQGQLLEIVVPLRSRAYISDRTIKVEMRHMQSLDYWCGCVCQGSVRTLEGDLLEELSGLLFHVHALDKILHTLIHR